MARRQSSARVLIVLAALAAGAAVSYKAGVNRGLAIAPSRHAVEAEKERRARLWDEAFLSEDVVTEEERACEAIIEEVQDLLEWRHRMDDAARWSDSPHR